MSLGTTADFRAAARRFSLFTIVLLLALLSLLLGVELAKGWLWPLVLLLPLLALGVWDLVQPAHSLMRNYPLMAHFRWLFEELRPYLRQYIVEDDHSGKPYSHDERALIYARAKGQEDRQPFGTELDAYHGAFEWMTHSIAPKPVVTEPFRIKVGGADCKKHYEAAILNISAMSFGSLGPNAIEALNWGAKLGGFYHDTGEGGISRYHRIHGGDIVYELGTGYFGARNPNGSFSPERFAEQARNDQIRMVEIKLSQGAKPGHGGILPGAKVSPEISEARGVAAGVDCISPSRHTAFSTPAEMMEFIATLRELSGGKPVGFKLCVGHPTEVFALVKAMLKTGIKPDFIVVDGKEGGTGAAPAEFSDHLGMPLREGLILMRNALVGANLRGEIRLAASGKIVSGFSMAANLAIGADWCNAARAFMFSLGCVQSMRCHTNRCPTGVTTNDPVLQRGLVVALKAQRVASFQRHTVEALAELVAAAGVTHPQDLMPRHIWHRLNPIEVRTLDRIYNFLEPGVLLAAPDMTPYAEEWRAADPDSFEPRMEVGPQREATGAA
ncbi:MAG TPA: FMN-binding glutamate synthase family protein [Hypericibacter adhaerens]|uniref:FMN-binding glutamate synthase family protein n=1 Tax=Hypericibacter adhaerens TaxID=2602016 RepID=UPI002C8AE750|nr:FMN-binding glutamate synthase family protein [Hypericibacter adhaerens]HWA43273.1 FMN-binding glutamate synthase family protein [Hypericibacter adhaerens]